MAARTMRDLIKALEGHFHTNAKTLSFPSELRRMIQTYVEEQDGRISSEDAIKADQELKTFWIEYVKDHPQKYGAFVGVLRELRPGLRKDHVGLWWNRVVKAVIGSPGNKQPVLGDVQDYLVKAMTHEEDDESEVQHNQSRLVKRICGELLEIYIAHSRNITEEDNLVAPGNGEVATQVEQVLIAFGRKQPKDLFHALDDLVIKPTTRLQALTLLNAFLRHQAPHLYLVINTPLIEHLLKCLMNDTSTTILAVALTSLIMLLPHVASSLPQHLPRLFLIYSRLLCWEKFSPLSTDAQRNLVTDDRVDASSEEYKDHDDVGIDQTWEKLRPKESFMEEGTPELLTYFTYLYGLYPLNLMSYVRKPRRYLKNLDFPRAEDFDLDQDVIRARTQQFQQVHLLHPNFFNMTVEEELADPKWPKMDPADVVGECHSLCINARPSLTAPGPPPTGKLPEVPSFPPLTATTKSKDMALSPSASHTSFRSLGSGHNTPSTALSVAADDDSPVLKPQITALEGLTRPRSKNGKNIGVSANTSTDDFPLPAHGTTFKEKSEGAIPITNLAYLQNQLSLLRNELNFERWHKAQYSEHIAQIARKNVRDATIDAELLNLSNANRTLKQQLDNVCKAREATIKDAALTRKQAVSSEAYMSERVNKLKKQEDRWRADADDLSRLRTETEQLRELLVSSEARELNQQHKLELMQRDLDELREVQEKLDQARHKLREYEYREFDFGRARRESEILHNETEKLKMRVKALQEEGARTKQSYSNRINELESRQGMEDAASLQSGGTSRSTQVLIQQAVADSQVRLVQLRKAHSLLQEKYTDLELEHQSMKARLDMSPTRTQSGLQALQEETGRGSLMFGQQQRSLAHSNLTSALAGPIDTSYEPYDDLGPWAVSPEDTVSRSDPTSLRYQPPARVLSPIGTEATIHNRAGLTWNSQPMSPVSPLHAPVSPLLRTPSVSTKSSNAPTTYNRTAPLTASEKALSATGEGKKDKIKPDSEVRVYGRGGAQNIKLKNKPKTENGEGSSKKGFLKRIG